MEHFIRLTDVDGFPVAVNRKNIVQLVSYSGDDGATTICFEQCEYIVVKESLEEILNKIQKEGENSNAKS